MKCLAGILVADSENRAYDNAFVDAPPLDSMRSREVIDGNGKAEMAFEVIEDSLQHSGFEDNRGIWSDRRGKVHHPTMKPQKKWRFPQNCHGVPR
jgi:hypothetical protein